MFLCPSDLSCHSQLRECAKRICNCGLHLFWLCQELKAWISACLLLWYHVVQSIIDWEGSVRRILKMVQGGFKDDSLRGFLKAERVSSKLLSDWRTWRSPKYCVLLLFLTVFRPRPPERGPGPSQWGSPWILMNVWRYILRFPSRPLTILRLLYWHNELEMVLVIGTGAPALSDSHSLSMWCLKNGGDTGKTCVSISISALQTTQGCVTSSYAQLSLLLRDKVHL